MSLIQPSSSIWMSELLSFSFFLFLPPFWDSQEDTPRLTEEKREVSWWKKDHEITSSVAVIMCRFQRSRQSEFENEKKVTHLEIPPFLWEERKGRIQDLFSSSLIQTMCTIIFICWIYMIDAPLTGTDKSQSLRVGPGPLPCPGIGTYSERHIGQWCGHVDWQLGVQSIIHVKLSTEKATVVSMKWSVVLVNPALLCDHPRLTCCASGVLYSTM